MKSGFLGLCLLVVGLGAPLAAGAQVSAYGEFSASLLHNLSTENTIYGVTTGVLIDGPKFHGVLLSGDIQGRFLEGGGNIGQKMNGLTVGPRFAFQMHKPRISPFAEFLVGFARYKDQSTPSTTDSTFQINGGASKMLTPRWDAVVDFSYAQYFYGGGQYNPKTFSIGGVYHFVKR